MRFASQSFSCRFCRWIPAGVKNVTMHTVELIETVEPVQTGGGVSVALMPESLVPFQEQDDCRASCKVDISSRKETTK